ncbi:MAG: hypothetical protein IKL09_03715 [Clostridia bacterium]|nr:hypothetical protein [Clostridia bacterium]
MKKDIETKLTKFSKEELVDIINKLCEIPDVEKSLILLVCPTKRDIDRELSSLERWCNSVANNPYSERAENGLYTSASLLWKAIDSLDANDAAKILYEMHDLLSNITEFSDAAVDIDCICCSDLKFLLENNSGEFSEEEKDRYEYLFE